jgi:hypothetical protein
MYFSGCVGSPTILELKDVQQFKVLEKHAQSQTNLELSGLCFHSALAVDGITLKTNDPDLVVMVRVALAHGQMSGSFDYNLVVPNQVDRVLFGRKENVVWTRQSVSIPAKDAR